VRDRKSRFDRAGVIIPRHGVANAFTFGSILSITQARQLPLHLIAPSRWKKDLQLTGKDKHAALHKARLLYPTADLSLANCQG